MTHDVVVVDVVDDDDDDDDEKDNDVRLVHTRLGPVHDAFGHRTTETHHDET